MTDNGFTCVALIDLLKEHSKSGKIRFRHFFHHCRIEPAHTVKVSAVPGGKPPTIKFNLSSDPGGGVLLRRIKTPDVKGSVHDLKIVRKPDDNDIKDFNSLVTWLEAQIAINEALLRDKDN